MWFDQEGYLCISDPWIATLAVVVATAIVLWCHRRLVGDAGERPATAVVRMPCRPTAGRERRDDRRRRVA
jgi:hypothetical protein